MAKGSEASKKETILKVKKDFEPKDGMAVRMVEVLSLRQADSRGIYKG